GRPFSISAWRLDSPAMRRLITAVALALLASCARPPQELRAPAGTPVVLISIDTLRADHLPAYGYRAVETPAIDGLRDDGFLFEHLYEPHSPYEPPEPFKSRYPLPYDGEIASADAVVGELLNELRRLGVYERAAIVLLSDHGEGLGQHGEEEHGVLLYNEDIYVPLIVKLPGAARRGTTVASPAQLTDVVPTLVALLGLARPTALLGANLLDLD